MYCVLNDKRSEALKKTSPSLLFNYGRETIGGRVVARDNWRDCIALNAIDDGSSAL